MMTAILKIQNNAFGKMISFFRRNKLKNYTIKLPDLFQEIKPEEMDSIISIVTEEKLLKDGNYMALASKKLSDTSYGEHKNQFILSDVSLGLTILKEVSAYHIKTVQDWNNFVCILNNAETSKDNYEGEEYETMVLYSDEQYSKLRMPECHSGPHIGSNTTICDNYIDENSDVWGSQVGSKAERLYFFFIEDIKKYAVVYMNYFCL